MIFTGSELVCPRGKVGENPIVLDIGAILQSELRQDEVATVTKFKAPELLAEFNKSWRELHKLFVQLQSEKLKAEKAVEHRRAVLLLEVVPGKLAERKLTSNDAYREAIITLDLPYQAARDTADEIEAVCEYLKGKLKSFENAYSSVKKIMGEDSYNMGRTSNPDLSGDAGPTKPLPSGFGKAKY